jgi:enoyl-CoA hydratase/carnithine racemase
MRNPLSVAVLGELDEIISSFDGRGIIFTGSEDVFASGADLREIAAIKPEGAVDLARRGQDLFAKIAEIPRTAAAINGFCFGGALDLALSCKVRIASPNAVFSHPGANLGIMTGWGGTQRLPRLIGEARALEMFFLAKRVSTAEALLIGLIDDISDDPAAAALRKIRA